MAGEKDGRGEMAIRRGAKALREKMLLEAVMKLDNSPIALEKAIANVNPPKVTIQDDIVAYFTTFERNDVGAQC